MLRLKFMLPCNAAANEGGLFCVDWFCKWLFNMELAQDSQYIPDHVESKRVLFFRHVISCDHGIAHYSHCYE